MRLVRSLMLCWLFLLTPMLSDDGEYRLGQGVRLGESSVYLGGYFSLEYVERDESYDSLALDDLALMLYGEFERSDFMIELESYNSIYQVYNGTAGRDLYDPNLHIERLYMDYFFDETLSVRIGKFHSKIGIWNTLPINVLRDTSSTPMSAQIIFPHFTNGLDVTYSFNGEDELVVDALFQATDDMDALVNTEIYNNFDIDLHTGVGVSLMKDAWEYRLNIGYFQEKNDREHTYVTAAFRYEAERYALQGEAGMRHTSGIGTGYAAYVQGVYEMRPGHEAVARIESYDTAEGIDDTFAVLGYTYRPLSAVALKGEYQWHRHDVGKPLWVFSVSVLF